MRVREMEDVLGGMQGISSFEWYCPGQLVRRVEGWIESLKLIWRCSLVSSSKQVTISSPCLSRESSTLGPDLSVV